MSVIRGKIDQFDEGTVVLKRANPSSGEYLWGQPVYKGDATACFDDGLLYRVIELSNNNRWSFYNDTLNNQMHVSFVFGKNSKIKALENSQLSTQKDGSLRVSVMVYPMQTQLFIEGTTDGYVSDIKALPLTDAYLADVARQDKQYIDHEAVTLFNLVDEKATTDQMVRACVQNKIKFIDFTFPPDQKSIQIGSTVKLKILPWQRPCMFLSDVNAKQARLFRNGIHPINVDEGDLGDSWLTGAIACLAQFPDKIRDIFRHPESVDKGKQQRTYGVYRVTLNKNGWWTSVIVDDYLPVAGGRPKFARSKGDPSQLWVSILQKAYAKTFGGYGFVIAGDPMHALQDISGFPCSSFDNAFSESAVHGTPQFFTLMQQYSQLGYLLIFTSPTREKLMTSRLTTSKTSQKQIESVYAHNKLLLGHTYAVVKIGYFPQKQLRLVQFRNPWAQSSTQYWAGPWNKKDPLWKQNKDVADYFHFNDEDDGTFYMEWADVHVFFTGCGVCFIQHPVYDYRIKGTFFQSVPTTCLEINVTVPTVMTIILSQDDKRGTDKVQNAPIMISVANGGGSISPMRVDLNSGFDNDHPTPQYTFLQTRDVSMLYEFRPQFSPYFVIPRVMSTYARLPYTIGLLSPLQIGKEESAIRVAFRALAPENRVFDNFQRFNCDTLATETEFQAKGVNQFFPDIYVGTVLQTSDE